MRKTCKTCKRRLVLARFGEREGRPLSSCKACVATYGRAWRRANPDYLRPGQSEAAEEYARLKSRPCSDCGHTFPQECMDFDHRPDTVKVAGVARMVKEHRKWADVQAEIDKCDLVCANCHRIRTAKRRTNQGGTPS